MARPISATRSLGSGSSLSRDVPGTRSITIHGAPSWGTTPWIFTIDGWLSFPAARASPIARAVYSARFTRGEIAGRAHLLDRDLAPQQFVVGAPDRARAAFSEGFGEPVAAGEQRHARSHSASAAVRAAVSAPVRIWSAVRSPRSAYSSQADEVADAEVDVDPDDPAFGRGDVPGERLLADAGQRPDRRGDRGEAAVGADLVPDEGAVTRLVGDAALDAPVEGAGRLGGEVPPVGGVGVGGGLQAQAGALGRPLAAAVDLRRAGVRPEQRLDLVGRARPGISRRPARTSASRTRRRRADGRRLAGPPRRDDHHGRHHDGGEPGGQRDLTDLAALRRSDLAGLPPSTISWNSRPAVAASGRSAGSRAISQAISVASGPVVRGEGTGAGVSVSWMTCTWFPRYGGTPSSAV